MRIAVFGGSFNPVHIGHLKLVKKVKTEFNIDKVIVVPTYSTPLKDNSNLISGADRFNMCKLAFEGIDFVEVSDFEILHQKESYTYITLEHFKSVYPDDELFFVVGADMFNTIDKWKNPDYIFKSAVIIVVERNGSNADIFQKADELSLIGCKSVILNESVYDISSTEIRGKFSKNEDVSAYLDCKVIDYINNNNLYRV